jgi:hypothetical protein
VLACLHLGAADGLGVPAGSVRAAGRWQGVLPEHGPCGCGLVPRFVLERGAQGRTPPWHHLRSRQEARVREFLTGGRTPKGSTLPAAGAALLLGAVSCAAQRLPAASKCRQGVTVPGGVRNSETCGRQGVPGALCCAPQPTARMPRPALLRCLGEATWSEKWRDLRPPTVLDLGHSTGGGLLRNAQTICVQQLPPLLAAGRPAVLPPAFCTCDPRTM